jgi:ATP-dependent Clp protease ATP-binding subunit ClpC
MVRLDMSEYMEKHAVARMIGAPPGYVGYEEGGQLTEAVRRRPYSVVLFDEIEKAHPDVFNVLLQILEEGRLTDAQGRKVDFKNSIVIMTSNLGARDIVKGQSLGFTAESSEGLSYSALKERVTGELKKMFRPEFLNRVDEVIVFHDLTSDEIKAIVDLMVSRLRDQLYSQGMGIALTEEARDLLAREGFDPALGARPLRRAIQRLVEDPLSEQILAGQWQAGDVIEVYVEADVPGFRKGEGTVSVPVTPRPEGTDPGMPSKASRSGGGAVSGGAAGD